MVNPGDIVTCQITAQTMGFSSADDVVQQVNSLLASEGYGVLTSSTQEGVVNVLLAAGYGVSFQATLQVQAPTAFAQATDLLSIVENAFYQVTGAYPTAATAPTVQIAGGSIQSTGLPSQQPTGVGGTSSDTSLGTAFTNFLDQIKSLGEGALVLVVLLVLGLVFVVGYSPNTREVAGAFA